MQVTVISVGKIKESFYAQAISEYVKRLSKYCKLTELEVADEKAPEQLSELQMEQIKDKEADRILAKVKDTDYVITLEIEGKLLTSEGFSKHIELLGISGKSSITMIIGGSLGLGSRVKKRSDYALSFSQMTFPHQLMKVILLEQVYRAFRIMKNEPYHK